MLLTSFVGDIRRDGSEWAATAGLHRLAEKTAVCISEYAGVTQEAKLEQRWTML